MARIRCPFCHQEVDKAAYPAHEAEHTKRRPDGQYTDYMTLPPEDREQSDLAGVPRVYVHTVCRVATEMPEDIIRSYLKDPYMHSDNTFCCGCGIHVPLRQCVWTETGQDLQSYKDELRRSNPQTKPRNYATIVTIVVVVLALLWGVLSEIWKGN
jgi:hypothetical protein